MMMKEKNSACEDVFTLEDMAVALEEDLRSSRINDILIAMIAIGLTAIGLTAIGMLLVLA